VQTNIFASAGFDGKVQVWDIESEEPVSTLLGHGAIVYNAIWHPKDANMLASASGDNLAKVWDVR